MKWSMDISKIQWSVLAEGFTSLLLGPPGQFKCPYNMTADFSQSEWKWCINMKLLKSSLGDEPLPQYTEILTHKHLNNCLLNAIFVFNYINWWALQVFWWPLSPFLFFLRKFWFSFHIYFGSSFSTILEFDILIFPYSFIMHSHI